MATAPPSLSALDMPNTLLTQNQLLSSSQAECTSNSSDSDIPGDQLSYTSEGPPTGYSNTPYSSFEVPVKLESSGTLTSEGSRRFKPDLLETARWHGGKDSSVLPGQTPEAAKESPRRFVPQLIETTRKVRRKFEPELVESSRRSRRIGDTKPAISPADRTDVVPSTETIVRRRRVFRGHSPSFTPVVVLTAAKPTSKEARTRGITLPKRCLSSPSSLLHHYKSPDLETIESSESEGSNPPSPSSSRPASPAPLFKVSSQTSLCGNNKPSGRLLAVAAANAERQLRARALAAFPNDDSHQSVQHYVDIDHTPNLSMHSTMYEYETARHNSTNWDLMEIQKHHQRLETERLQEQRKREARRKLHQHLDKNPWAVPVSVPRNVYPPKQEVCEPIAIVVEDKKVRPPMLGEDIEFPRCESPDQTRFDVTQGPESLKRQMCYLSGQTQHSPPDTSGLWSPRKSPEITSVTWSRPASRAPSTGGGGLWGGVCADSGVPSSRRPSGLVTPRFEHDHGSPPKESGGLFKSLLPPSPPASMFGITTLEETELEMTIEAEFDDHFITQVYNYMSLGYPAVARDYDEELSKVTRTSIAELQQDDNLAGSRGYIRLGEDAVLADGVKEENCARWRALRLYVHEWARQQPNMTKSRDVETGWTAGRKNSWGI